MTTMCERDTGIGLRHENTQLALNTIYAKSMRGIPSFIFRVLKHAYIERLAGVSEGEYRQMQVNISTCLMDQWIPENPFSTTNQGYGDDAAMAPPPVPRRSSATASASPIPMTWSTVSSWRSSRVSRRRPRTLTRRPASTPSSTAITSLLFAGLSSTDGVLRTGTPSDIQRYLQWIVEKGPRTGLFISSVGIYPDMPWDNVRTYVEGIQYYHKHER